MKMTWDVFGRKIKVKFVKGFKEKTGSIGQYNDSTGIISIDASLDSELKRQTLYHELRHAMQFRLGYLQILDRQLMELDCEHFMTFIYENFKES